MKNQISPNKTLHLLTRRVRVFYCHSFFQIDDEGKEEDDEEEVAGLVLLVLLRRIHGERKR